MGSGSSFGLFCPGESPLGLVDFLTCPEASDYSEKDQEVTYFCFCLFCLASDCSEMPSERTLDSNLWMN